MNASIAPNAPRPTPPTGARAQQVLLVQAIEAHLAAHPHAADSATGVARWWLGVRGIHATAAAVEAALAEMVAQQRLRHTTLADGSVLYSRPAFPDAP